MTVFVCYEENCPQVSYECGAISKLTVIGDVEKALEWLIDRVKEGIAFGFVPDQEEENVSKIGSLYIPHFKKEIEQNYVVITMFKDHQENWNEYYDIWIKKREVN